MATVGELIEYLQDNYVPTDKVVLHAETQDDEGHVSLEEVLSAIEAE